MSHFSSALDVELRLNEVVSFFKQSGLNPRDQADAGDIQLDFMSLGSRFAGVEQRLLALEAGHLLRTQGSLRTDAGREDRRVRIDESTEAAAPDSSTRGWSKPPFGLVPNKDDDSERHFVRRGDSDEGVSLSSHDCSEELRVMGRSGSGKHFMHQSRSEISSESSVDTYKMEK